METHISFVNLIFVVNVLHRYLGFQPIIGILMFYFLTNNMADVQGFSGFKPKTCILWSVKIQGKVDIRHYGFKILEVHFSCNGPITSEITCSPYGFADSNKMENTNNGPSVVMFLG